jgi:cytochrome c oxidase subunit 3
MSTTREVQDVRASDQAQPSTDAGTLGMRLFLLTLAILFTASLVGYLVVRARAESWPPPGMPKLPAGLWVSTIILLVSSGTMHVALVSARRGRQAWLITGMLTTTLLAGCFLVSQGANWMWLVAIHATVGTGLYMFTFYVLTGLHGLHIVGGIILLSVVTSKAFAGQYSADYYPGVRYSAMYWHFLDAVWLVMFTLMFLV